LPTQGLRLVFRPIIHRINGHRHPTRVAPGLAHVLLVLLSAASVPGSAEGRISPVDHPGFIPFAF